MVSESVSVLGIARILKISINTVQAGIRRAGKGTAKPPMGLYQASIEVDELRTFIGNKENHYWVAYALSRTTGKVLDFVVGRRTNRIERKNLAIWTDVKRLSRWTICFSRSRVMLENCLKIYFWGAGK